MYMRKANKDFHDSFLKSKEVENYINFIRKNFWWQAGKYTVSFQINSPEKLKQRQTKFQFELTQNIIEILKNNLDEVRTNSEYLVKSETPDFTGKPGSWAWFNVVLEKL